MDPSTEQTELTGVTTVLTIRSMLFHNIESKVIENSKQN